MELLLLGAGMGVVGGVLPNPLKMIALAEASWGRWGRAFFVLAVPPLLVDGAFFFISLFFVRLIPVGIVRYVAYVGGAMLIGFASFSLWELRRRTPDEMANSAVFTPTAVAVAVATLAEVAAPGTWIYWITVAGPVLVEGRLHGFRHVLPFFAGGLMGYYGAEAFSTWLLIWGASLHQRFKQHLVLAANLLLLLLGVSYLIRAYRG